MKLNKFERFLLILIVLCISVIIANIVVMNINRTNVKIQSIELKQTKGHHCTNINCPMQGLLSFSSEYDKGSDSYYTNLTHWENPSLTAEEIEDYVFESMLQDSLKTVVGTTITYRVEQYTMIVHNGKVNVYLGDRIVSSSIE